MKLGISSVCTISVVVIGTFGQRPNRKTTDEKIQIEDRTVVLFTYFIFLVVGKYYLCV